MLYDPIIYPSIIITLIFYCNFRRYYLSRNTLFIHFMCCTDAVKDFFIEEAFIAVFLNDYYLQYIVLSVPMFCPDG